MLHNFNINHNNLEQKKLLLIMETWIHTNGKFYILLIILHVLKLMFLIYFFIKNLLNFMKYINMNNFFIY